MIILGYQLPTDCAILDKMMDMLGIDTIGDYDIHECACLIAEDREGEGCEPTERDYRVAFRYATAKAMQDEGLL